MNRRSPQNQRSSLEVERDLATQMKSVTACLPTVTEGVQTWVGSHRQMLMDLVVVFGQNDGALDRIPERQDLIDPSLVVDQIWDSRGWWPPFPSEKPGPHETE